MPNLKGKTIGLYISGKQFSFSDEYYMAISQFLQAEEDRSWGENVKTEFLVRLGERLRLELQVKTEADSVYFLNSDLERGSLFQQAYRAESNSHFLQSPLFDKTDFILVINEMDLSVRYVKSMIIRSNRMIPERTMVQKAALKVSWFTPQKRASLFETRTCYDAKLSENKGPLIDIYQDESAMGSFLSRLFSAWWAQSLEGIASDCPR